MTSLLASRTTRVPAGIPKALHVALSGKMSLLTDTELEMLFRPVPFAIQNEKLRSKKSFPLFVQGVGERRGAPAPMMSRYVYGSFDQLYGVFNKFS
jgi:hypothetical protein